MKKNPIGKYLLQNWYYYVFAFGSMALSVFLDMLAPLVTLHIVDDVLVGHKMELLWKYLAAFLLIGAAKALFQYIKEFLFDVSSVRVASQMRDNLFRHVQRLSVEYFDKNNTGELLARVRDDVDRIWDILGFAGMLILEGLICIMMAMVSMVKLDLPLTLVSVAILPFVAGIAIRLEKELDRVYDAISEENAVMNTVAQENLAGVRTVKSFAREPYEIKKFRKHNQKYCDLNMDQARVLMKYDPAISFLTKLMRVLVLRGRLRCHPRTHYARCFNGLYGVHLQDHLADRKRRLARQLLRFCDCFQQEAEQNSRRGAADRRTGKSGGAFKTSG